MPSPTWSKSSGPTLAAAIAAAVHYAWLGDERGASNRFLEALRKMIGPEELERVEMLALQLFHAQPRPPEGYEPPPPSAHFQICPGCQKLRRTRFTAPQRGRVKLEALRDPTWLQAQFEKGRSAVDVAKRLGCSRANVVHWADTHGISLPRTAALEELDAKVGWLHRDGKAPGAIARELETTVERVRKSLRRQGLATKKSGHHYHEAEWWRVRLQDRGMSKYACAREAGIKPHAANYYVHKFGLEDLVDAGRHKYRKFPKLADPAFLRELLRRHDDNYESAAREIGCASSLISRYARDLLGREKKHSNHVPHSEPAWWRERLDRGETTWEMAAEAGVEEPTARERLRILGWLGDGYRNNAARERQRRMA